ncbi:ribonuclease toxin immunity protein CdiI [Brevibacillus brevis]|nr:ribonuclease toxin immunity protein CdiI [Brevibacillus brevis]
MDVLGDFVLEYGFVKRFRRNYVTRQDYLGVVYSDEFVIGDEGYFGENKVLFYYGLDDEYDIVNYQELYDYLQVACEFYVGLAP